MPTPQFPAVADNASLSELTDAYVGISRYLTYLLSALDTLNVSRLDAKVIIAETITTDKIQAGAITTDKIDAGAVTADKIQAGAVTADKIQAGAVETDKIAAGAVTADKITVAILSAISADMGEITAGKITTSAEIDVGTDARIGNILYLNESDGDGLKGIIFSSIAGKTANINAESGDVSVQCAGFITFTIGSSQGAVFNQRVTAPVFNATTGISINNEAVPTTGYVNEQLSLKANGSGLNAVIPPGSTINVVNGVITGYV